MRTFLFFSLLCLVALNLSGCLAAIQSFDVTGPIDASPTSWTVELPYVPNHLFMEGSGYASNISAYYVHIEYLANIINPVDVFTNQVHDQPGIESSFGGLTVYTNDNNFTDGVPQMTITPIVAEPDMIAEVVPPQNSVQCTQIQLVITVENHGDRRPVDPTVEITLPTDLVDVIGWSANRPNVTINATEVPGGVHFLIAWKSASESGDASDLDVTIDLFVHCNACAEFAAHQSAGSPAQVRQAGSSNVTSSSLPGNASSSSLNCPPPGTPDFGDTDPGCWPDPNCPEDLEPFVTEAGACAAFCLQGIVYPNYNTFLARILQGPIRGPGKRAVEARNFVVKLTDDPTLPGAADPTVVFLFANLPLSSSTTGGGGDDSSSDDLLVILLPLFLGLCCLCCLALLIAAAIAAAWWFLTGREKMHTRVQWIPGRKGKEDDGL